MQHWYGISRHIDDYKVGHVVSFKDLHAIDELGEVLDEMTSFPMTTEFSRQLAAETSSKSVPKNASRQNNWHI